VRQIVELARGTYRLLRVLRSLRPDVVHLQWARPIDYLFARICRLAGARTLVFTSHVPVERVTGELGGDAKRQQRIVGMAAAVITLGPGLTEALRRANPQINGKVHTIRHGNYEHVIQRFDRAEARRSLRIPLDATVFTFLGQIRPRKGVETLLEAFRAYRASGGDGILVIVGSASEPAYFESLRENGSAPDDHVRWIVSRDPLPQEQLDLAVSAANEIVLPFNSASQSGAAIYGMSHGRCVVTTDVGEVGRTVGDRGVVLPPSDPGAVADAMRRADEDPAEIDRLGVRAREYALSELSWTSIASDVRAIYEEVTS
jgi:glycosyltransferase involved in cell wall biosynthesis